MLRQSRGQQLANLRALTTVGLGIAHDIHKAFEMLQGDIIFNGKTYQGFAFEIICQLGKK